VYDTNGLEVLTPQDCLRLLGSVRVGRIAYTDQALPAVQPVTFLLDNDAVLVRTGDGAQLTRAARNTVVAFQVDELDPESRSGWAVMVVGYAQEITDPDEVSRMKQLPLRAWVTTDRDHFIRVSIELIDGRRVRQDAPHDDRPPVRPTHVV
jgi:nitroimidazol reductase NimA-like FMN-containing flavoprotein (pyridoxamine 5'-phosphate oxidase superfamily)